MGLDPVPSTLAGAFRRALSRPTREAHIVDQLIAERATRLSRSALWPMLKPLLHRALHYRQAVAMADAINTMSGREAFDFLSALLVLELRVEGLENIPRQGGFILAPTHPTGIADGIAVYDMLAPVRQDIAIFANRDALRAAAGFRDLIIPVEWRQREKTRAKSRDTLEMTARAFGEKKAIVLFPSGRIAYWREGRLNERPWQPTIVALARRYGVPVVPAHVSARNSGLFYLLSRLSSELRDMTVFHEFLNKTGAPFTIKVGRPIPSESLEGDAAELARRLQFHTTDLLATDPEAEFLPPAATADARAT